MITRGILSMRRLLHLVAVLAVLVSGVALAASYRLALGTHVDDATALAYLQARQWDTTGDGTGDPQEGTTYWDSDDDKGRVWTGAAWADMPGTDPTALHTGDTGAALTWLDQTMTTAASPVLAVTNMTGSAAGLDSNATAHASADGASHTYIDQDVTSAAAPVLAVTNMTGSAAGLDSDATTHAAKSIATGHTGTLANLNTAITDANLAPHTHEFDLTGATYFQAGGTGTSDGPSGLTVYGADVSGATTCEISGGLLQIDLSASGADKDFRLVAGLGAVGLQELYKASVIEVTVEWDLDVDGGGSASNFDTNGDLFWVRVGNEDTQAAAITESPYAIFKNTTGNRGILASTEYDDGYTESAQTNVTNWDNAGHFSMRSVLNATGTAFYDEDTPVGYYSPIVAAGEWHVRPSANAGPYLVMWIRAKDGGRVAADISAITVTIMFIAGFSVSLRRRLDPYDLDIAA